MSSVEGIGRNRFLQVSFVCGGANVKLSLSTEDNNGKQGTYKTGQSQDH